MLIRLVFSCSSHLAKGRVTDSRSKILLVVKREKLKNQSAMQNIIARSNVGHGMRKLIRSLDAKIKESSASSSNRRSCCSSQEQATLQILRYVVQVGNLQLVINDLF